MTHHSVIKEWCCSGRAAATMLLLLLCSVLGGAALLYLTLQLHYFMRKVISVLIARFFKSKVAILDETYIDGARAMSEAEAGSVSSDLGALLESADGADLTLVVGGSEFPAHSLILAARSPVFAAMLRNDMKEARSRRIEITDMREDVLRQVLSFIYTDTAPELGSVAAELLAVADKYFLPLLKKRCEQRLVRDLTVENAAATAALAIMHRCPGLRDAAVGFMADHPEKMESAGWAQVLRENAEAAVEVCKRLAVVSRQLAAASKQPVEAQRRPAANRKLTEKQRQKLAEKLVSAASHGRTGEVWALLQLGAPANAKAADGESALHKAARKGREGAVSCLISAGADVNVRDSRGRTPLHAAASISEAQHIIWMLLAASADKDVQDNDGNTPLHLAASNGRVQSTKALLLAGVRWDIKNNNGNTPPVVAIGDTRPLLNTY